MSRNWYQRAQAEIKFHFGDDWELFCDLLAATSLRDAGREPKSFLGAAYTDRQMVMF